MATVRVLATGGTTATATKPDGRSIARARGPELVDGLAIDDVRIEVEDIECVAIMTTPATWAA
jgi:hypothetical protein